MFTHSVTRAYKDSSGASITGSETVTSDTELNFDGQVAATTTNQLIGWTCTQTLLQSVSIYCDQAVTIKTNSSGSPQETITLVAGQNLIWTRQTDGAGKIPFAGNVTALYISNAGSSIANVKIRALAHEGA